jgi:SAM-dependent methyltransferase
MSFKDHFSQRAGDYAKFRPRYPRELFEFVAAHAPGCDLALDCATGNGQAALALAEFFDRVTAVDASETQIANATHHARVEYRVASAEAARLENDSCDAVTVAQALHWLDLDAFYAEAKRLLKPRGVLAVWAYNYLRISPEIDAPIRRLHDQIVGPFWPAERHIVGRGYRDLPFPFRELETPPFRMQTAWTLDHLLGYLRTWSATQRFVATNGNDPVEIIEPDLQRAWGDVAERSAIWPLTTRIGLARPTAAADTR